jgi:hypothetical protein
VSQGDLFAEESTVVPIMALQTWALAPPCAFNQPTLSGSAHAPGWTGPHHCFWCWVDVERACAQFAADVKAGKYDAQGYTPAERKAQQRKARK